MEWTGTGHKRKRTKNNCTSYRVAVVFKKCLRRDKEEEEELKGSPTAGKDRRGDGRSAWE